MNLRCFLGAHNWHYCEDKLRECPRCHRAEVRGEDAKGETTWTVPVLPWDNDQ